MAIEDELLKIEKRIGRAVSAKFKILVGLINAEINRIGFSNLKQDSSLMMRLRRKIPALIKKAGLNKVNSDIRNQFSDISKQSTQQLAIDLGVSVSALRAGRITPGARKILVQSLRNQKRNVNDLAKRFRGELRLNKISLLTRDKFDKLILSTTNLSTGQYGAQVTTAVQGFDNAVTSVKANAIGAEEFRYAGVEDDLNRQFCADRVNQVFTDAEAATWDNGQNLPADIYLGGYRCRHRKEYFIRS